MSVTVSPQEFRFVSFDAGLIQRVAESLLGALGMTDRNLHIEVDGATRGARIVARARF